MSQWLKTLTGCLCILTILMHLVPRGKFLRYVRFYGGLLFFLVAVRPVWNLLSGEGELERLLQLSFLRDDYYDLETSIDGMAELKNDQILEAYRGEIRRQISEIASAYGFAASDVRVTYDTEDGYRMTGVSFALQSASRDMAAGLGQNPQDSAGSQTPQETSRQDPPDAAVEAVRQEIASVYSLNLNVIRIRREDAKQWESG